MNSALKLLKLARKDLRSLLVAILLGSATISSSIALAGTSAYLISMAALQPSIAAIQTPIVAVRLFGITRGVFRYLERYVSHDATFSILTELRVWFYENLERLMPAGLERERRGELLNRSVADIDELREFYLRVFSPYALGFLITLGSTIYYLRLNGGIALTHLGFMLMVGLGMPLLSTLISRRSVMAQGVLRGELRSRLVESLQGIADLSAFGQVETHENTLLHLNQSYSSQQEQVGIQRAARRAGANLFMQMGVIAVLIFGIGMVTSGEVDGTVLASLVLIALASYEAVLPLGEVNEQIEQSLNAAERIFEISNRAEQLQENFDFGEKPTLNADIETADLSFSYRPDQAKVLEDFTLCWKRGERIAIVGPSGAGKSTLVKLLLGYWPVEAGDLPPIVVPMVMLHQPIELVKVPARKRLDLGLCNPVRCGVGSGCNATSIAQ